MVVISNFRGLDIWNEAMDLCEDIYHITERFPKHEQYNLVSQMRKAVVSIPSNIAEGFVRKHPKEFKNFLSISLGSLAELETQIYLSIRLNYLVNDDTKVLFEKTDKLGRKISSFYKGIRI